MTYRSIVSISVDEFILLGAKAEKTKPAQSLKTMTCWQCLWLKERKQESEQCKVSNIACLQTLYTWLTKLNFAHKNSAASFLSNMPARQEACLFFLWRKYHTN